MSFFTCKEGCESCLAIPSYLRRGWDRKAPHVPEKVEKCYACKKEGRYPVRIIESPKDNGFIAPMCEDHAPEDAEPIELGKNINALVDLFFGKFNQ